jgi:signal peptidase
MSGRERTASVTLRDYAARAFEVVLVVVLVSLVAGAVVGQPVLLSYVETGSMEPTIDTGDGFVAVPAVIAGPPSEGDIVVYRAQELQGGGLTTHRIVGETERGYVTRGDANPFTDQSGGEPPVTEDRIVAHALQVGGHPVVIPALGTAISGVQNAVIALQNAIASVLGVDAFLGPQGVGLVLFGIGLGLFGLSVVLGRIEGPTRDRSRSRSRGGSVDARRVTLVLLVIVLLPANVAMVVPSGVHEMTVDGYTVAAAEDVDPGETAAWEYTVRNSGFVPVVVVFESADPTVSIPQYRRALGPGDTRQLSIGVTAPPPGETHTGTVREYRYLPVLPPSVIEALHDTDPIVAWTVINAVLTGALLWLVSKTVGFGRVRTGATGQVSIWVRFRRRFG